MAKVRSTVWADILAHVRLNHPELVRGWFGDLRLHAVKSGTVRVRTRNRAQSDYLDRHCSGVFTEAAQAATGRLVSIDFVPDQEPNQSSDDSDVGALSPPLPSGDQLPLIPGCTFDHFVTGPCNRLAHAAALAVAQEPGRAYNPFFIHGPVGLGKTHLLQAICHAVSQNHKETECLYLSCETFVNHFIEAIERGAIHEFRHCYRHVGLLVIDDIQFLAERERSQEEFFHTFNTLHQSQRQIILSADCPPSEIPSLEERLISRFNSGLVALLDRPCLETRMAIVRKKAKLRCIEVPEDVVRFIAGHIDSNIRELEGALLKLDALGQAHGVALTLDLAQEAFESRPLSNIRIPAILEAVARRFDVKISELQGKKRSKAVTYPRHVCMYLARKLTSKSLEEVGGYFGGRDHSTVLHASRSIERTARQDAPLQSLLDELSMEVKNAGR